MINHREKEDALYMLHLICKVFYTSNHMQMAPYLMEGENIQPWILFFKTILDMECPADLSSATSASIEVQRRDKTIFWKIKGLTAKITYRIFVKYGDPVIVQNKVLIKSFSNNFSLNYSIPLFESHLQLLFQRKTNFVGSKCLNFNIKFIAKCSQLSNTMEKLKPFVENILYDTIIPIMFITEKDLETFNDDPIEYIRNQYDFTETLFQPKNQVQDLLSYFCKYISVKPKKKKGKKTKKPMPDYLQQFLEFAVKNLNEYNEKVTSGQGADWRIKEALLFSICVLRDEIMMQKPLKEQMEQMLLTYVQPELLSEQPFMRMRACQTYEEYGDSLKYKTPGHTQQVVDAIFKSMGKEQPLPVRFHAAKALEKMLRNEEAMEFIKSGIEVVINTYLDLMNEFDNEELVIAFENIMTLFEDHIAPFACNICEHLKKQYIRLIGQDADEDEGESILAAVASFTSIRRILDSVNTDVNLLAQIEHIIYPCLLHSLTADGLDSIEEGIDCITMLLFNGYKDKPVSQELWKLFPQLLYVVAGTDENEEGGYGMEYVNQVVIALKNYTSRDSQGMLAVGQDQDKTHLQLTFHLIQRVLAVNRNSKNCMDGIAVINLIIAFLENMQGQIDAHMDQLLTFLLDELLYVQSNSKLPSNYKSMILQAFSMAFVYNAQLVF
mmetsp:Transcript_29520/g.44887  ORF Transcript_29520/g.44887 Transcript_29520/m.44887 type:complete len:666 (+) Transcript_29520:641-2638(+)